MSNREFYKAFEDAYRGSREAIKKRARVYLPFVEKLKSLYPEGTVLDIGCGRGEWIELLSECGISAKGVDLDEGMLDECVRRSFEVECIDGIEYLKNQPDESLMVVSAFHVVEHIPFEALKTLVQEAKRVLKPAGLLILETPNPENLKVGTENFYLDPTHIKPIPMNLLAFLPKFYKYVQVKTLRFQEDSSLLERSEVTLADVVQGVSPDYAIIAQKEAEPEVLKSFESLFSKEYGLALSTLLDRFEARIERFALQAENAEAKASQAEAKAIQIEHEYYALLNSHSWKITRPLRELNRFRHWFVTGVWHWVTFSPSSRPRRVVRKILFRMKYKLADHPRLKKYIGWFLTKFPVLNNWIVKILMPPAAVQENKVEQRASITSPRARQIYGQLRTEIEKNKKGN